MKILILEDEIPAYQKLTNCLVNYFKDKVDHDWSRSLIDAKLFLEQNKYDFILSDIQLLDGLSFDLFSNILVECPIIFCSAYDNYLFQAFNTNGIAYILKPYTQDDFNKAIEKYQSLFNQDGYDVLNNSTIDALKSALKEEQSQYKKRFVIKKTKGIQLLNVTDISIIQASGDFCIAIDNTGNRHTISQSIGAIFAQLNPNKFYRINRSEIVSIDNIQNIESHFKNRLLLTMNGSDEKVMTSTSSTSEFRKWLEQ